MPSTTCSPIKVCCLLVIAYALQFSILSISLMEYNVNCLAALSTWRLCRRISKTNGSKGLIDNSQLYPPTWKQLEYARQIALKQKITISLIAMENKSVCSITGFARNQKCSQSTPRLGDNCLTCFKGFRGHLSYPALAGATVCRSNNFTWKLAAEVRYHKNHGFHWGSKIINTSLWY